MGLVIANNVPSLRAQHSLQRANDGLSRSLERLSTGLKVNRGADGPSTLVISEKQRAQISGLEAAINNAEKGISLIQTAEGALSEISSLLVRIRSLAIDSANSGVNDDDAMAANQAELENAIQTIDRIAENTQFATKKLLNGAGGITGISTNSDVHVLRATTDTVIGNYDVTVTTPAERANVTATTGQTAALAADEVLNINGVDIELVAGLTQSEVIARINDFTSQTGVIADDQGAGGETRLYTEAFGSKAELVVYSNQANAVDSTGFGTTRQEDVGVDIEGTIGGVDADGRGEVMIAREGDVRGLTLSIASDTGANAIQTVSGASIANVSVADNRLHFQVGPNQYQLVSVAIDRVNPEALGLDIEGNLFTRLSQVDVTSGEKAQHALEVIDAAIDDITNTRGELGAFQSYALQSTANNLRVTLENTVNAESVIRDTDFASEIANFTKQQVLVQAGTSVLSSANQSSQLVLSLLG